MIGMGPFIPHKDTPLGGELARFSAPVALDLGLKMLACLRLLMPDANMASTTALQALDPVGREQGLLAGGNVIMPNVTDPAFRPSYQLYEGKPGLDENSEQSRLALEKSVEKIGEKIAYGQWGNAPRFDKRSAAR
jgi:biotin synthase